MEKEAENVAWSLPQRQSPAAIFIMLWSTSLKILKGFWPVLVLYFFKGETDENSISLLWLVLTFVFFSLVSTIISYWFKQFYTHDDSLIIKSGWFRKKTLSIPFQNIQAVHLEQNVWQQFLGVSRVSFDATGSEEVEAQLEALPTPKAEALKNLLMAKTSLMDAVELTDDPEEKRYQFGFTDILKLSLTANHLEAFLILVAVGFNLLEEIKQVFDLDEQDYFDAYATQIISQSAVFVGLVLLGIALVSVFFSAMRTLVKFYQFSLIEANQDWKITYGLFNREQKTIPVNKIQILSWRATWLRRKFNYWIMHVQSVGYTKDEKQNIQIPVLTTDKVQQLASVYQQYVEADATNSLGIEPAFWKRKLIFTGLPMAVFPMLASAYWLGAWSLSFVGIFIYLAFYYHKFWRNYRWQTQTEGIQIVSGAWGRKITLLNWKKIQQVHIHQSIYQRNHQLANLVFITAGGRVTLPYLPLATVTTLADQVLYDVESKNESWM